MKTRKNKKFYNFTEKQKKRDRSLKAFHYYTVGKIWKRWAARKIRASNKKNIYLYIYGDGDYSFEQYRRYMWWDM